MLKHEELLHKIMNNFKKYNDQTHVSSYIEPKNTNVE